MPARFLKRRGTTPQLISVSQDNPLPVDVRNTEEMPIAPFAIDTLIVGEVIADGTVKDLLGNTGSEIPTLTGAKDYKRLILIVVKPGTHSTADETITFTLKGRAADADGNELSSGWLTIATDSSWTPGTASNEWRRYVFQAADGAPLGFDMYRIEVQRTAGTENLTLRFNLKGER